MYVCMYMHGVYKSWFRVCVQWCAQQATSLCPQIWDGLRHFTYHFILGVAHRNGCLWVDDANSSAWLSRLQGNQVGHPQSAKNSSQKCNVVYIIIRCEIKMTKRGTTSLSDEVDRKKQLWLSLDLGFALWFLLQFPPDRIPWPEWRQIGESLAYDDSLEGTMRN